jgi:hypothetical protein
LTGGVGAGDTAAGWWLALRSLTARLAS